LAVRKEPDVTTGLNAPPERELPIPEMSAAQLARYRRALVRYLRRCRKESPRYGETRACLADVIAEEQERRLSDRASGITQVPRIHV
jgi:hypothetical protein